MDHLNKFRELRAKIEFEEAEIARQQEELIERQNKIRKDLKSFAEEIQSWNLVWDINGKPVVPNTKLIRNPFSLIRDGNCDITVYLSGMDINVKSRDNIIKENCSIDDAKGTVIEFLAEFCKEADV